MYKRILLAIDINDESSWKRALPTAVELVRAFDAELDVVTVVPDFGMSVVGGYFPEKYEKEAMAKADEALHAFVREHVPGDIKVRHVVENGTVYARIIEAAREVDADLIVVAAHRQELKDFLLGPNAARVVRHADRSVLVVRDQA